MCGDKTEESPFFFEARPATARGRFNLFHKKSYARVQRSAAYSTTAQVGTAISDALGAYSSTSEMNTAIADAVDALNVGQYQDAAEVQFLIDQALLAYWDQSEVSSFVAGELANYATSASVSSSISSALSSYDDSSQVDSKIITALLDFYTRAEVDQAIADATSGSVDLSNYYTSSETQSYVANELLAYYPRTELDSLLTATLTQYWTSGRTQTEIDDAIAGAGFQTQADVDLRYFVRAPGAESGQIFNLVQEQFTPRIIRNLLLEAIASGDAILGNQSTLRLRCDSWTKAVADGRFLRTNDLGPLDARYFVNSPGAEGGGIFNLVQTQFTPRIIRNLLCQTPLSAQPILGNGSTLQISCDCWSKGQSDTRSPHRKFQQPGPAGHGPGEQPGCGSHGGPHRQLPHGHRLPGHAAAAERRSRSPNPERHHHQPRRGRPRGPSPAAAPCRPRRRSRATSGSRHRWCPVSVHELQHHQRPREFGH